MKITKLGHCSLLIEHEGVRVLTDPGVFTADQNKQITNVDVVLITHEHGDHLHVESLEAVLEHSPTADVVTNTSVANILKEKGITSTVVEDGESYTEKIRIEAYGDEHKEIYKDFGNVQNTGYFIAETLFYPGDALYVVDREVLVLALPVAGPWLTIKEAIDYAIEQKPERAFPVHDGMYGVSMPDSLHKIPATVLPEHEIEFSAMKEGDDIEV